MKLVWESKDIWCGLRTKVPGTTGTGEHIIGYDPDMIRDRVPRYALISLADGCICAKGQTAEEIAGHLNSNGDVPINILPFFETEKGVHR